MMRVMLKRLTITGSTLRIRSNEVKGAHRRGVRGERAAADRRRPRQDVIDTVTRSLKPPRRTRAWMAAEHIGKILLTMI